MSLLLPKKLRIAGYIILLLGIILGITRFYFGIKLEILDIKVFAVYSNYFETNYFKVIPNHFSEEATALLLLVGLFLIVFTKEKIENDVISTLRLKSFILTFYVNTVLVALSFIFIYGFSFLNILVINVFSPLIIYILLFKSFQIKGRIQSKSNTDIADK